MPNIHDLNGAVPTAFRLLFPQTVDGVTTEFEIAITVTLASLSLAEFTGVSGNGTTETVRLSATADYSSGSNPVPTNLDDLEELAQQWARDEYRLRLGRLSARLAGLPEAVPDALHGAMEWHHGHGDLSVLVDPGPGFVDAGNLPISTGGPTGNPSGVWCPVSFLKSVCLVHGDPSDPTRVTGLVMKHGYGTFLMRTCPTETNQYCTQVDLECCPGTQPPPYYYPYPCTYPQICYPPPTPYPCELRTAVCGYCDNPDEVPVQWRMDLHQFEGGCAVFNGLWFLEYVSPCRWSQRRPDGSWAMLMVLGPTTAAVEMSAVRGDDIGVYATYIITNFDGDCCGHNLTGVIEDAACPEGVPHTITLVPVCCDGGLTTARWWCVEDGTDHTRRCIMSAETPEPPYTVVKGPFLTPDLCEEDCESVLSTAQWWCVEVGTDHIRRCILSVNSPGAPFTVISGPHVDAVICGASCTLEPPQPLTCAQVQNIDLVAYVDVLSGGCTCFTSPVSFPYATLVGSLHTWTGTLSSTALPHCLPSSVTLKCLNDVWRLDATNMAVDLLATSAQSNPTVIVFDIADTSGICLTAGGTLRITFVEA